MPAKSTGHEANLHVGTRLGSQQGLHRVLAMGPVPIGGSNFSGVAPGQDAGHIAQEVTPGGGLPSPGVGQGVVGGRLSIRQLLRVVGRLVVAVLCSREL